MARNGAPKNGNSKIRFIMLEADLSEGDLTQVTQAIQNALRPSQPLTRLIQAPPVAQNNSDDVEAVDLDMGGEPLEEQVAAPRSRPRNPSKPRVAKTPKVLDDIDFQSEPSLEAFVSDFDIKTDVDRYLVIALWFRDTRGVDAITVDQVYTCFRKLSWSTASNDFAKPLRNLRDEQSMRGGSKEGFSLTLIGAGKIEKKKRA